MENKAGTYDFGEFSDNEKELDRLISQAKVGVDLEKNLLTNAGLKEGMDVLDIACGPGVVSCEMAKMVKPGTVTGVDINEKLIQVAKEYSKQIKVTNADFSVGNAYELSFPENSFDFVYARFVFQHLEDCQKVVDSIYKVLRPNGIICITDVDDSWLTLYPTTESFIEITESARKSQKEYGGDRLVGRKLGHYLHTGNFNNVNTKITPVTSNDIGLKNFLDITTGFKHEQSIKSDVNMKKEKLDEVYKVLQEPYAWGAVGVFTATGTK